ncbi:MAG: dinitrogenase iron-molybdenum cofactor biosynthesis protein [Rhodocyclaceae bacterium]|nr:dinitrogenase iron-molybdenum cofactor biosynthesis protein [Rhodocyclaceae bacterium]
MAEVSPMTREVALRIALAAKTIETDPRAFTALIAERLGLPITVDKLAGVTVTDLKQWMADDDIAAVNVPAFKEGVRILWGELEADGTPAPQPYAEGDMPGSLRVAMASNTGDQVDGHFGSCTRFLVYQVSQGALRLIDVRSTAACEEAEDRNAARAQLIGDCHVAYVQSIGGPAAAKVIRAGVHPIKWPAGGAAPEALAKLQESIGKPPPWLARIMGVEPASLARFAEEEADA